MLNTTRPKKIPNSHRPGFQILLASSIVRLYGPSRAQCVGNDGNLHVPRDRKGLTNTAQHKHTTTLRFMGYNI